jgi:MFS family permease
MGDEFGRRRLYVGGLASFTAASLACGLAPSPTTLVLARVLQGAAGALLMPQVLSIIGVTYRGAQYARALSAYGVALGLAAVGGQLIGGALVEADVAGLGWRGCFLINVTVNGPLERNHLAISGSDSRLRWIAGPSVSARALISIAASA